MPRVHVDGFVLKHDIRSSYVWFLFSSKSRWFCFKTWYSELLRVGSILQFWWLFLMNTQSPVMCFIGWIFNTSPQMATWIDRAPKTTSYNKVGTLVWRQMGPSLLHLASRSVVQCVRLMVRGWLFKLPSAKPAEFPTTIAHTLWWILKSIHTQICRTNFTFVYSW